MLKNVTAGLKEVQRSDVEKDWTWDGGTNFEFCFFIFRWTFLNSDMMLLYHLGGKFQNITRILHF